MFKQVSHKPKSGVYLSRLLSRMLIYQSHATVLFCHHKHSILFTRDLCYTLPLPLLPHLAIS
ncbi:hypothetical protein BDF14DRAFT_1822727 [Spinellus fusiger]|nr:hypothetical protein BDF14DRAFT_1822727 [Spinellus fusiger]